MCISKGWLNVIMWIKLKLLVIYIFILLIGMMFIGYWVYFIVYEFVREWEYKLFM